MAIELIELNTPDYLNSSYLFSKNPLFWEFQRADLVAFSVVYENDFAVFQFLEPVNNNAEYDYINSLLVETVILYIKGDVYNGEAVVLEKTITQVFVGTVLNNLIQIKTDLEYIGNDANCIVNLTAFDTWSTKFKITINNQFEEFTNAVVSFTDGKLAINIQYYINKYMSFRNNWQYNNTNWADTGVGLTAKIEAIINYRGGNDTKTQLIATKTFIHGANQSVNRYKSSAYLYKLIEKNLAKFLTFFDKIHVWSGYPRDISFIFAEGDISNLSRLIDVGGTITEKGFSKLGSSGNRDIVHRVNLTDINANCYLACGYENEITPTELYVDEDYVDCDYVDPCPTADYILRTETKEIIYDSACKEYPVYLKWRNELGGVDYWLFDCRYTQSVKLFESQLREVVEYDLSVDGGKLQLLDKKVSSSLTIHHDVTEAQKAGFMSLINSKHIQMYVGFWDNRYAWIDVMLSENSFNFNVFNKMYSMKFTINTGELYL